MPNDNKVVYLEDIFLKLILDEIDEIIRQEESVDIYSLPLDIPSAYSGRVIPIYTTYIAPFLIHILEVSLHLENKKYLTVSSGDGGVLIHRSEAVTDLDYLMVETEEDWVKL